METNSKSWQTCFYLKTSLITKRKNKKCSARVHHLTGCFLTGKNQIATAHWVRVAEPPPKKGYRFGRLAPKPTGTKRKKKRLVAKALLRSSWSLLSIAAARNPTIGERETPCRALLPNYFCVVASARVAANLQFSTCRRPDSTRGTVAALRCVLYILFFSWFLTGGSL